MVWGDQYFTHDLIRKYVVTFGAMFDGLHVKRKDKNGVTVADIKVPLQYAAKEKTMVRLDSDPDLDRPASAIVPVMTFEIASPGIVYATDRKLPSTGRKVIRNPDDKNTFKTLYNPVPYDIMFNLYIYVKFQEDGTQLIEQILPFFTPDWTVTMELVPEMNEVRDVPTVLTGVNVDDVYDGDFKKRRMLVWTLRFVMHGWLFGPVRPKPMIKFTRENWRALDTGTTDDPIDVSIIAQPGLTANGEPTHLMSDTIDYHLIDVNDDYGFAWQYDLSVGEHSANQSLQKFPPDGTTRKYDEE